MSINKRLQVSRIWNYVFDHLGVFSGMEKMYTYNILVAYMECFSSPDDEKIHRLFDLWLVKSAKMDIQKRFIIT